MPSHFSTIGIPLDPQQAELSALVQRVVGDCVRHDTENGRYLQWSSSSGAELWLQLDPANHLIGMNSHYSGKSRIGVELLQRVVRPDDTELEGAFYGWVKPEADDPTSDCYPLVFDVPDFKLHQHVVLPVKVMAQIAAFAHQASLFDSEVAFSTSQTAAVKLASRSFVPVGAFIPQGEEIGPPKSTAMITGHVLAVQTQTNELTGKPYYWAFVETLCANFDVLIDPELLEHAPKAGNVLSGTFWLSGRIYT